MFILPNGPVSINLIRPAVMCPVEFTAFPLARFPFLIFPAWYHLLCLCRDALPVPAPLRRASFSRGFRSRFPSPSQFFPLMSNSQLGLLKAPVLRKPVGVRDGKGRGRASGPQGLASHTPRFASLISQVLTSAPVGGASGAKAGGGRADAGEDGHIWAVSAS